MEKDEDPPIGKHVPSMQSDPAGHSTSKLHPDVLEDEYGGENAKRAEEDEELLKNPGKLKVLEEDSGAPKEKEDVDVGVKDCSEEPCGKEKLTADEEGNCPENELRLFPSDWEKENEFPNDAENELLLLCENPND